MPAHLFGDADSAAYNWNKRTKRRRE
jgi:hypothetical protein